MKNKLIFNKFFFVICLVLFASIFILIMLGNVSRRGYLSEFQLDESLSNISSYSYKFRIKYYSKIFRNSDIYNVYADTDKIIQNNNFIKEIIFDYDGSPFGILTSTKELQYNEKIDNIDYKLKIKLFTLLLFILSILLLYIFIYLFIKFKYKIYLFITFIFKYKNKRKLLVEFINKIKYFCIKYRKYIFVVYSVIVVVFLLFVVVKSNIIHKSKLAYPELIAESRLGYVYKSKIEDYKDNKLFSIDNNSIQLNNTNDIKYYGYALEITNKPLGSWHSTNIYYTDNNTFVISNESDEENAYYYNIQVPTYIGDKYKITILAKQVPDNGVIKWHLNGHNWFKEINKKEISNDYMILTDTREVKMTAGGSLDLHFIIPRGITEIESIKIESLNNNLNLENNDTIFTLQNKFNDNLEVNYWLKSNTLFNYIMLILILPLLNFIFIFLNKYLKSDKIFFIIICCFGIILFIFQFWLCFPGFYNITDSYYIMSEAINNEYTNWHPFIIGLTLHFLYKIFGYHEFYLFFLNMFLWYIGLTMIVYALYYKFRNKYLILLFFISFIGNIFFANMTHIKDATATLFFFFAISILIFKEIVKVNNKIFNIITTLLMYISLLFALLWRHNFIVTIYPIFIYIVYKYLKNINVVKYFFVKFCSIMLIIACILIFIVKTSPYLVADYDNDENTYPVGHPLLLQIAGCAVPANDGSLIPSSWYVENKTFEDLKEQYYKNKVISDFLVMYSDRIFRQPLYKDKKDLKNVLFKYIKKYPGNYIKHMINYSYNFILNQVNLSFLLNSPTEVQNTDLKTIFTPYYNIFGDDVGIKFSKTKFYIYSFLFENKLFIKIIYSFIISVIIFFITGIIWLLKPNMRNNFLLLSFSLAFSSFATIIIVCAISPLIEYRYIYPSVILSIFSLILFIIFIFDIGGINSFFIELKSTNKFKGK